MSLGATQDDPNDETRLAHVPRIRPAPDDAAQSLPAPPRPSRDHACEPRGNGRETSCSVAKERAHRR
jgi:hypothetical protein